MDVGVTMIELPGPVRAAASDGTTVWCAVAGGIHAYTASGTPLPTEAGPGMPLPGAGAMHDVPFVTRDRPGDAEGDVPFPVRDRPGGAEHGAPFPPAAEPGARVRAGEGPGGLPELRSLAAVPGTVAGTGALPGALAGTVVVPRTFAAAPPMDSLPQSCLAGTSDGRVHWLDQDGVPVADARFTGRVLAGGGEIWAVGSSHARRLTGPGHFGEPVELPGLDRCAVEGERLWWTSTRDTLLRGGPREIDLGTRERGGMVVCAGSLWISVAGGLLRVSAWSGEPRRLVPAPEGPVPFLVCANGVLAGGGRDLFTLDPATGGAARLIGLGLDAPAGLVIAAGKHLWVFPTDRPHALIVAL
ncbi:hypothetical protein FH608_014680 [Nonomuraea phyllanthi]|uniref:Uncharacterized protein n=1 Tax=Nonomuraea phyllanthi TaxID=2219224 RepID=A0A5C4WKC9_9ACTN|nr:hypothetical protein [Nonomuraea phyllanthi]KAB8194466.1 hypothetical protein FH608_014680 [Nonomuraea phyllanthi]